MPDKLTAQDHAFGQFRLALFKRGQASKTILKTTADGLEAWLNVKANEDWASRQTLPRCPDRPEPHSLLTCLLEEIASYRRSGYVPPPPVYKVWTRVEVRALYPDHPLSP